MLLLSIPAIAAFQITKNFYQIGLLAPVLGMAVLFALPGLMTRFPTLRTGGLYAMTALALLCFVSEAVLAARFYNHLPDWSSGVEKKPAEIASLRELGGRCGIDFTQNAGPIIVDHEIGYASFWKLKEPIFFIRTTGGGRQASIERTLSAIER